MVKPMTGEDVYALPEPSRSWKFAVSMPPIRTDGGSTFTIESNRVETASIQHPGVEGVSVYVGGTSINYPDKLDVTDASITFYESQEQDILAYYMAWQSLIVDTNGDYGLPVDYKKPVEIFRYDVTNNQTLHVTLTGVFPKTASAMDISNVEATVTNLLINFSVDYAFYKFVVGDLTVNLGEGVGARQRNVGVGSPTRSLVPGLSGLGL